MFPSQQSDLASLRDAVAVFDALDLVAKTAALQLVPENVNRLVRLYGAVGIAASIKPSVGQPRITAGRWRKLLNEPPLSDSMFAIGEDPFNNPFTEVLTFHGGSYIVFPGVDDDACFVFRHLSKAVFNLRDPLIDADFVEKARALCAFVLVLSGEVARRAGFDRHVELNTDSRGPVFAPGTEDMQRIITSSGVLPEEVMSEMYRGLRDAMAPVEPVIVPASGRYNVLVDAVTFTRQEIRGLLAKVGASPGTLDSLVLRQGALGLGDLDLDSNPLFARPILHDGEDRYVVAMPGALVLAMCNGLVRLAQEHSVEETVAERYRWSVYFGVERSLDLMGNDRLLLRELEANEAFVFEGLFSLDSDKMIHVLLATDNLHDYDPENAASGWADGQGLSDRLQALLEESEAHLLERTDAPNELLHLVLVQGIASGVTVELGSPRRLLCPLLMLSASDLEVIALVEGRDQLVLWKYARAYKRVRERRPVLRISTQMDEFHHYRHYRHSYYFSDDAQDGPLVIPMGGAGALRREVQRERDFRGVRYTDPDQVVEVSSLYDDASIPIYAPWWGGRPNERRVEILVEALPVDIWIIAPESAPKLDYRPLYFLFADMIAYWLWQLAPTLAPHLKNLADHRYQVQIHFDFVPDEGWFETSKAYAGEAPIEWRIDADTNLRLTLRSYVTRMLESADNEGERRVMREVLRGIRRLQTKSTGGSEVEPTDVEIEHMLDLHAPLGHKKKLLFMSGNRTILHTDEGLPRPRKVQAADVSEILDELGDHLSSKLRLPVGRIPDDQRTKVMGEAVAFFFHELEYLVSTLSPENLLETLVAYNEQLLYEQAQQELLVPTRIACFGSESEMVDKLREEHQELRRAALANRFLIEYVSTRPPQGLRPLSLSVYDRLMALSSEIINKGMHSDAIAFGIADLKLEMLRSGRLGMHDESYEEARDQFLSVYLSGEIYRSTTHFASNWRESEGAEKPEDAEKVDNAVKAEFGLTFTELIEFLTEAMNVGLSQAGEPKVMLVDDFLVEMEGLLGWDRPRVEQAFHLFALRPRANFLSPPAPLRPVEVYPWRFSRELSYLRRPLPVRPVGETEEVVWGVRHCFGAMSHLMDLCIGGRLKAKSPEMRKLIGEMHDHDGEEFNDYVADVYETFPGWIVRCRVKKVAGSRIERDTGQGLGDIDVLAADPKKRVLWAVEAKGLAFARNPAELANELKSTFQTSGDKRSAVDKHIERVAWLRENLDSTLDSLDIPASERRRWKVEPLVVVDHELQSPYIVHSPVPVVPVRMLESWHRNARKKRGRFVGA